MSTDNSQLSWEVYDMVSEVKIILNCLIILVQYCSITCDIMAFKFQPPDAFDFSNPSGWPEWRDQSSRYWLAVKLKDEVGEVQVSALICAMGGEAEHVIKPWPLVKTRIPKTMTLLLASLTLTLSQSTTLYMKEQSSISMYKTLAKELGVLSEACMNLLSIATLETLKKRTLEIRLS